MQNQRLFWNQIKAIFEGEWVELTNVDWDWDKPFPKRACVRHHSTDRAELMNAIRRDGLRSDSTVLFLGFTNRGSIEATSAVVA